MPPHARFSDDDDKDNKDSMTPLEDREKCIPPRKRRHQQQPTTCYTCCSCDHCCYSSSSSRSPLKPTNPHDVTADNVALFEMSSGGENDNDDDLLDAQEYAQLTQEVATLKDAVVRMQRQVSAASEKLVELRALVKTLVALRASTKQQQEQLRHQELKKRRRVDP